MGRRGSQLRMLFSRMCQCQTVKGSRVETSREFSLTSVPLFGREVGWLEVGIGNEGLEFTVGEIGEWNVKPGT
jgi:hypothetical protein